MGMCHVWRGVWQAWRGIYPCANEWVVSGGVAGRVAQSATRRGMWQAACHVWQQKTRPWKPGVWLRGSVGQFDSSSGAGRMVLLIMEGCMPLRFRERTALITAWISGYRAYSECIRRRIVSSEQWKCRPISFKE